MTPQRENGWEPIAFVGTSDLAGHFRGKGFPVADLEHRLRYGVGLTHSNIMLSAFGPIYATPFGTAGELMLLPEENSRVQVQLDGDLDGSPVPLDFFLGDIVTLDRKPWDCCPRNFLRRALESLERESGLRLRASFEQEFVYSGMEQRPGLSYSFDAFRRGGLLGSTLLGAMRQAGVIPDSFLAEYAPAQYELTAKPAIGLRAADQAVVTRELIHFVAEHQGHRATLAPILAPNGVGNGTHIHLSLLDAEGVSVLHDPAAPLGLSAVGRSFAAGVAFHLPAIAALTAPSVASYYRLRPGKWAPTVANIALQDRGAAIRICGGYSTEPEIRAGQFNIEFRVSDASASPYVALGAVVWAGLDGIRRGLELPGAEWSEKPLPPDLSAALDLLEASGELRGWLGAPLLEAYLILKREEIRALESLSPEEICQRYADVY